MSKISVTSDGMRAKVELDGQDISHCIQGLAVRYDVHNAPTAVLDVVLFRHSEVDAEDMAVEIPDSTAELLVQLGWTPPSQKGAGQ